MKIVGLEEHVTTPPLVKAWTERGLFPKSGRDDALGDIGEGRLAAIDDLGIDVQVLSLGTPGLEALPPADAVALGRDANDRIAAAVAEHPDRLQAFVNLPTPDPAAAADELRRGVTELGLPAGFINGRVGERNIDHPDFEPVWEAAEALGVPIYLHPGVPPAAVTDAYYSGLSPQADVVFSRFGIGWHYETGIQLLRLIYGRVFDRHPDLQIITGHWGEVVLFYAERVRMLDDAMDPRLDRPLADYLTQNASYTPSGMYSQRYLRWAIEVAGIDRILFATDYPFLDTIGGGASRAFLEDAELSEPDRAAIAHGNWERLTAGARR